MMRRIVLAGLAVLGVFLGGAFCFWDVNAGSWPIEGRAFVAWVGLMAGVFAYWAPYEP